MLSVDQDRRRIALGLKQMTDDPWATDIPGKYQPGQIVTGPVTKITNFGVFVGLEDGLEGLLHISELADHKVENPEEVVKVGEMIEVKVLRVDPDERKIGLSRKRVEWAEEAEAAGEAKPRRSRRRATAPTSSSRAASAAARGPLIQPRAGGSRTSPKHGAEAPADEPSGRRIAPTRANRLAASLATRSGCPADPASGTREASGTRPRETGSPVTIVGHPRPRAVTTGEVAVFATVRISATVPLVRRMPASLQKRTCRPIVAVQRRRCRFVPPSWSRPNNRTSCLHVH